MPIFAVEATAASLGLGDDTRRIVAQQVEMVQVSSSSGSIAAGLLNVTCSDARAGSIADDRK
jgi:hypothetical protein